MALSTLRPKARRASRPHSEEEEEAGGSASVPRNVRSPAPRGVPVPESEAASCRLCRSGSSRRPGRRPPLPLAVEKHSKSQMPGWAEARAGMPEGALRSLAPPGPVPEAVERPCSCRCTNPNGRGVRLVPISLPFPMVLGLLSLLLLAGAVTGGDAVRWARCLRALPRPLPAVPFTLFWLG